MFEIACAAWKGEQFRTVAGMLAFLLVGLPFAASCQQLETVTEVRAHFLAMRTPTIAAEIAGRVIAMPFRPGETFTESAVLVSLDCGVHRAREARAVAQRDRAGRQLAALQSLDRSGATSRLELSLVQADVAAAEAELRLVQLAVQRCEIRAPFTGTVVEWRIQQSEYVVEGQPLIQILDHADLELETLVPSHLLSWLKPGTEFEVELDEVSGIQHARIVRLAPMIDPVSQTVKVYARVNPRHVTIIAGMSGRARFVRPREND